MDVESTAVQIDEMAEKMVHFSKQLRDVAKRMRDSGDITYAAEAMNVVTNTIGNLRLDLLIIRPLREAMRE